MRQVIPKCFALLLLASTATACRSPVSSGLTEDEANAQVATGAAPSVVDLVTRPNSPARTFIPVPLVAQQRNYTCGVASLMSVLTFYGDGIREGQLMRLLESDRNNGTSYKAIAKLLDTMNNLTPAKRQKLLETGACEEDYAPKDYAKCVTGLPSSALQAADAHRKVRATKKTLAQKYDVELRPGTTQDWYSDVELSPEERGTKVPKDGFTLKQLIDSLAAGKPVIVLIQAFVDGEPLDSKSWTKDENGHYVVATGYDDQNIYFMDPWTVGSWVYIPRSLFVRRWHDLDSVTHADGTKTDTVVRHFGLVLSRENRGDDPFDFANMTVPRLD